MISVYGENILRSGRRKGAQKLAYVPKINAAVHTFCDCKERGTLLPGTGSL
ncbi:hypothetical protein WN55_00571 [Dufourea novaeangliae]|uniref:Uncharacterized protein n=1 Tax=Dufourea novaeangliae TaxID=178035 RepID=A0A154PDE5_DUFNO|nr:hypothetical protein WN55_00571 [Dufourea novaeangliae]